MIDDRLVSIKIHKLLSTICELFSPTNSDKIEDAIHTQRTSDYGSFILTFNFSTYCRLSIPRDRHGILVHVYRSGCYLI